MRQMFTFFCCTFFFLLGTKEVQAFPSECRAFYSVEVIKRHERPGRRQIDVKKNDPGIADINRALRENVIAQPQMISALTRALVRAKVGIQRRGTLGNILIYGPTGTGKTKSAEELARLIEGELIEIEGGDYQTAGSVTSLTGVGPMWAGHGSSSPILTPKRIEAARGKKLPVTIILINELDKAHPDFLDWWLKALDKGMGEIWLPNERAKESDTNSGGKTVIIDLKNTIIIATSNAAAEIVKNSSETLVNQMRQTHPEAVDAADGIGDLMALKDPNNLNPISDDIRLSLISQFKRPEFLGRWDDITASYPLLNKGYKRIINLEIRRIVKQFQQAGEKRDLKIRLTPRAAQWIIFNIDPNFGARNLSKLIDSQIELAITNAIASGEISGKAKIAIDVNHTADGLAFFSRDNVTKAESLTEAVIEAKRKLELQKAAEQALIEKRKTELQAIGALEDPRKKLDAIEAYVYKYKLSNSNEFFQILDSIPSGVGWGWKNKTSYLPNDIMKSLGFEEYKTAAFEYVDISVLFKLLADANIKFTSEQLAKARTQVHNIIKNSQRMKQNDLPPNYQSNLLLAAEALLHKEKLTESNTIYLTN